MKKFIEILVAVKYFAAMTFTGIIMLFVVVGYFFGLSSVSFSLIWQAIFIALFCGTIHFIAFTDHILKKMNYAARLLLFAVPLYFVVSAFAVFFKWFPANFEYWAIFTLAFLVIFGLLVVVFQVYFKITGNKYNQMLAVYKSKL